MSGMDSMNRSYPPGTHVLTCSCGAIAHAAGGLEGLLAREADEHRAQGHRVSLTVIEGTADGNDSPARA